MSDLARKKVDVRVFAEQCKHDAKALAKQHQSKPVGVLAEIIQRLCHAIQLDGKDATHAYGDDGRTRLGDS